MDEKQNLLDALGGLFSDLDAAQDTLYYYESTVQGPNRKFCVANLAEAARYVERAKKSLREAIGVAKDYGLYTEDV